MEKWFWDEKLSFLDSNFKEVKILLMAGLGFERGNEIWCIRAIFSIQSIPVLSLYCNIY